MMTGVGFEALVCLKRLTVSLSHFAHISFDSTLVADQTSVMELILSTEMPVCSG